MVAGDSEDLSIQQRCELLGVSRSSFYYRPASISLEDQNLTEIIDEIYTEQPFYGTRRIGIEAGKRLGCTINRKKVQRIMRKMGLQAIGPQPNLSKPCQDHKVFPYLLRGRKVSKPNEVWSTDITYVRLKVGFAYLTAVIDWYSRYVLSWRLSNTMETSLCVDALGLALEQGGPPEIFNTDQGSQYTSQVFVDAVLSSGAKMSMDGKGRALDNVFVERLWRSVKYENIYPRGYETMTEAEEGLKQYFEFYNTQRPHQSLGYRPPAEVYGNF